MTYSFTLVVSKYTRKSPDLDDMSYIKSHKTCLVAKNKKHEGLYIHPSGKIIKGKFFKIAGSVNSPILFAETEEVHIRFENFPHKPDNIHTDQYNKQNCISVRYDY